MNFAILKRTSNQIASGVKVFVLNGQSNAQAMIPSQDIISSSEYDGWEHLYRRYDNIMMLNDYVASPTFATYDLTLGSTIEHIQAGLELPFIFKISQLYPDETIYFMRRAHGGAALISSDISPAVALTFSPEETNPAKALYPTDIYKGDGTAYFENGFNQIKAAHPGEEVHLHGFLWMQHEAECSIEYPSYDVVSLDFISHVRTAFESPLCKYIFPEANIYGPASTFPDMKLQQRRVQAANRRLNIDVNADSIDITAGGLYSLDGLHYFKNNVIVSGLGLILLGDLCADAYINSL